MTSDPPSTSPELVEPDFDDAPIVDDVEPSDADVEGHPV